jgi:hypothetical protein
MFFVLKFELILIIGQIKCLQRAPEKYIAGAALDRADLDSRLTDDGKVVSTGRALLPRHIISLLLALISVRA